MIPILKKMAYRAPRVSTIICRFANFFGLNSFKTLWLRYKVVLLKKVRIVDKGKDNKIIIGNYSILKKVNIYFYGNNNTLIIGEKNRIDGKGGSTFYFDGNDSKIVLGNNNHLSGTIDLAALENTDIIIGNDCLFSSNIFIRTGDSHPIFDDKSNRINNSKNIYINDNVWIGQDATILKGVILKNGCIVGASSVVTKSFDKENIIIAGNPAKIIKENVTWRTQ